MTEELDALFSLAERHSHSVETLRKVLRVIQSGEDYLTLQQWQTYARLRHIIQTHDQALRERAMQLYRPSALRGEMGPSDQ